MKKLFNYLKKVWKEFNKPCKPYDSSKHGIDWDAYAKEDLGIDWDAYADN